MKLIKIEKQLGAKRLHREYLIVNGEHFIFSQPHQQGEGGFIQFKSELENDFKLEVDAFRSKQKKAQALIARVENVIEVHEDIHTQGSKGWLNSRVGIISASKTPFDKKGNPIPTYDAYVNSKVAESFIQINEGEPEERYSTEAMQIGTDLEHYGIERYEEVTGNKVEKRNLLVSNDLKVGASPDGVVVNDDGSIVNVEVKSVFLRTYIGELVSNQVTNTYFTQVQVQMFMLNADSTDLVVQTQQRTGQPIDIIISKIERDEFFVSNMIETIKQYEIDFAERYALLEEQVRTA